MSRTQPQRPSRNVRTTLGRTTAGGLVALACALLPAAVRGELLHLPASHGMTPHARRLLLSAMGHAGAPPGFRIRDAQGASTVPLTVQITGGAAVLNRAGFPARELSPSFAAVSLPPAEVLRLSDLPGVGRIDGLRRLHPRLDRSVPLIGATALHGLGLSGRGVMVAVVDTGVDFRHADLRNQDGTSRIAFLVDATTPRGSLHPELPDTDGMAVYTKADLDAVLAAEAAGTKPALLVPEVDESGHGTHVSGIAIGNGLATGNHLPAGRYVGVAPQATLCAVKGTRDGQSFNDQDILTGVRFCLDRAEALGMPVVVNLSLGSPGGPHDGSSALEMALDELLGDRPGRALVAAAGNSGEDDVHAGGGLLDGTAEIPIKVAAGDGESGGHSTLAVEIFFSTAAPHTPDGVAQIDLELYSPAGKVLRAHPGDSSRGTFPDEGVAILDNSDDTMTGMRGALLLLDGPAMTSSVKSGDWRLRIIGRTLRYDAWMVDASQDLDVTLRKHLDPDGYVEIPAAAHTAISVGAMRSRADWTRGDGKQVQLDRELLRVAPFSSGGPTGDGRFAPDVLAPGEFIISAMSRNAPPSVQTSVFFNPGDPALLMADDGVHGVLRGTSQATPHVSGALALLLELDPSLTGTALRELLRTTAATDPNAPSYGPRRGFGTLDLANALQTMRGSPPTLVDTGRTDVGANYTVIPPAVGQAVVTVTPRDPRGVPLGPGHRVDITTDAGDWLGPTVDTGHGRYERVLVARGPRGTRATVTAHVDGQSMNRLVQIDFAGDDTENGTPYRIAGCSYAPVAGRRHEATGQDGLLLGFGLVGLVLAGLVRRRAAVAAAGLWLFADCSAPEPAAETTAAPAAPDGRRSPRKRARQPVGGEYYFASDEALRAPWIVVHLGDQLAEFFDGDKLVGRSSICSGRRSHPTPTGRFQILEKVPEHISNRYGDYVDEEGNVVQANIDNLDGPLPPGAIFRGTKMPFFLRIVGGVGLHAGPLPGHPDSHGCIRLPPPVAQRLFSLVELGTPVTVED